MREGSRRKTLWREEILAAFLAMIAVVAVAVAAVTSGTTGAAAAVGVGVDGEESRFVP